MTALAAAIDATQPLIAVDTALSTTAEPVGPLWQVDDEVIQLRGTSRGATGAGPKTTWLVERGARGTTKATHLSGAPLTPVDPFEGTGGGGVTVDNEVDEPTEVTTIVSAGAEIEDGTANFATPIRKATITLTDAQIKALPTTGVVLVPAPGAGFVLRPYLVVLVTNLAAAYTNVDASGVGFFVDDGAGDLTTYCPHATFLGNTARRIATMGPYVVTDDSSGSGVVPRLSLAASEDSPLILFSSNAAAGDYTGGDAANTITATVLYAVIAVP